MFFCHFVSPTRVNMRVNMRTHAGVFIDVRVTRTCLYARFARVTLFLCVSHTRVCTRANGV